MSLTLAKACIIFMITQTGIIGILFKASLSRFAQKQKEEKDKDVALCKGVQAILRHNLYELHTIYCEDKKYAPPHVKEDFDNMYKQYHALGQNGVMDGVYSEFMHLPTQEDDYNE